MFGKLFQGKALYLTIAVFLLIIVGVGAVVLRFGQVYKRGIEQIFSPPRQEEFRPVKSKQVKKITIQKIGEDRCIEVTPDGIVRVFDTCGGELSDTSRLTELRDVFSLFRFVSEKDLSLYKIKPEDVLYVLTIETDEGTETIYIVASGEGGSEIGEIVSNVLENVPKASPTPTPQAASSPSPSSQTGATPTSSSPSPATPRSSPTTGTPAQTFSCEFTGSGQKKPYNVSGIICSTQPSPVP